MVGKVIAEETAAGVLQVRLGGFEEVCIICNMNELYSVDLQLMKGGKKEGCEVG